MIQNHFIGAIGGKGQGKTTWAMEQFLKSRRGLAFDACGEYKNCLKIYNRIQLIEYLEKQPRFRVAFVPRAGEKEAAEDLLLLCRLAFAKGKIDLFLEEADYFSAANYSDPALDRIIRYGRHAEINLTYTVRRFPDTSRQLTAQTDEYRLFRASEPVDLQGLVKRFGTETAEHIASLQRFEHIKIIVADHMSATQSMEKKNEPEKPSDLRGAGVVAGVRDGVRDGERDPATPGATDGK